MYYVIRVTSLYDPSMFMTISYIRLSRSGPPDSLKSSIWDWVTCTPIKLSSLVTSLRVRVPAWSDNADMLAHGLSVGPLN